MGSVFLGRFNFSFSYRPSSRNVKLNTFSRQFSSSIEESAEESIIRPHAWWRQSDGGSNKRCKRLSWSPSPRVMSTKPIVCAARRPVLQWGHSSKMACHLGGHRSLALIRQQFWWPTMAADIRESNCSVLWVMFFSLGVCDRRCGRADSSHLLPTHLASVLLQSTPFLKPVLTLLKSQIIPLHAVVL